MTDDRPGSPDLSLEAALGAAFAPLPAPTLGPRFERDLARRLARRTRSRPLGGARLVLASAHWCGLGAVLLLPLLRGLDRLVSSGWLGFCLGLALVPSTMLIALAPRAPARALRRLVAPLLV